MSDMKRTLLLCSAVLALAVSCKPAGEQATEGKDDVVTAPKGSIVYFDIDKVIEEYDMANDLRSVVETKVNSINQEVNRRGTKLEKDIKTFQDKVSKGLMVSSVAQAQQEKLQQQQIDFQNYAGQKQQEIAEEQQVMMNNILDAIKTFIDKYNAEKQFTMILTTQGGGILPAPVVAADSSLDITADILAGLNAEYVRAKSEKK